MARRMKTPRARFLSCLTLVLAAASAAAQSPLADPTQPPAGYAQEGDPAGAVAGGPVLESVVIPKNGKPLAVISGRQVRLGEFFGESRLVRVTEREAVLDGPAGIDRLSLTPGIEKTNIVTRNKAQASPRARSGSKQ